MCVRMRMSDKASKTFGSQLKVNCHWSLIRNVSACFVWSDSRCLREMCVISAVTWEVQSCAELFSCKSTQSILPVLNCLWNLLSALTVYPVFNYQPQARLHITISYYFKYNTKIKQLLTEIRTLLFPEYFRLNDVKLSLPIESGKCREIIQNYFLLKAVMAFPFSLGQVVRLQEREEA